MVLLSLPDRRCSHQLAVSENDFICDVSENPCNSKEDKGLRGADVLQWGLEIGAESKPRRGRLEREEGRGDTQLLPVTPAGDPLRGTPIGHTPGFVGARRARLGVDAPSAGTPPRAPVRGFPPTRRSTDRHTVIPRLRLCPRQDVMRPFTPHWVLTVGVAAGRGFTSTRYGFAFLTKHSKFTVCLSLLQTTGVPGEARPPRTAPAASTPTRCVSASPFPALLAGTGLPPICKSQQ